MVADFPNRKAYSAEVMKKMREMNSLSTPEEIRTALRKRTVQNTIWKNQAESGADCREELFAYIDLMTEDECKEFLNSVREAPFLPGMNMMWTEEVVNYLMFGDLPSNMRYSMDRCATFGEYVQKSTKIEPIPYRTGYVKKSVDKQYWDRLPLGGTANYYSPSQVLRLAIIFHSSSELAEYIAEKLFIKAADLEDCLKPTVKVPRPLPLKPRQRKRPQKRVVLQVPDGARVSIDVPESKSDVPEVNMPVIPKAAKVPKRNNPIVSIAPAYASEEDAPHDPKMTSDEINAYIKEHYTGFGGNETSSQIAKHVGISKAAAQSRIHNIRVKFGIPVDSGNNIDSDKKAKAIEVIKTRSTWFGGKDGITVLSKELGMRYGTLYRLRNKIQASMAAPAN